jgi:DNA-binding transcriptional LysR family regulator
MRAVEIFLSVCEAGGVTAAAASLNISQAAVSQRIAQLERELGTLLFDRSVRPQRLTPAGLVLRERASRISGDILDLRHTLERYRDVQVPELRVGVVESIASALVPNLVPELERFVGTLTVRSGIVGALLPELMKDNLDIAITSERIIPSAGLEHHPLINEPFVLLMPAGTPPPQSVRELEELDRRLPFVGFGHRDRFAAINRQFDLTGIEIRRKLHFVSLVALVDLVRQGGAWTILTPLCLYSARAPADGLVVAPLPAMKVSRFMRLAAPERKFGDVPRRISDICVGILTKHVVPALKTYVPFGADQIICGRPETESDHDDVERSSR